VRHLGEVAGIHELMRAADVLVLPSDREGVPNVVLEAMALEVPVVATRIAGVPTLVRAGQTGWLIEPGDTTGLDSAIEQSIANSSMAETYRQRASQMIAEEFSFSKRIERVASIYDALKWPV
jgi:glycosyltransferase involved in cell wall biosynthesis